MARKQHETREGWLQQAAGILNDKLFAGSGHDLPKLMQVSCGWPRGGGDNTIGQCFSPTCSANEATEIFVSPRLADPITVLGTLLHEMIHAAVGTEVGHRGAFKKLATQFGLQGRMTATFVAEETELHRLLLSVSGQCGPYPHAEVVMPKRVARRRRCIKAISPQDPNYYVNMPIKLFEEHGAPRDPWGNVMETVDA